MRGGIGIALGLLLSFGPALAQEAAAGARAQGGDHLIEALESAAAGVVAEVVEVRKLDAHGYGGTLRVETPLVGAVAVGAELPIGWEELAPSRAPRFASGDRVLVALERLPGASIWLGRIPQPELREKTLAPALRGDGFLRDPSLGSVTLLAHFLALGEEARNGPPGAGYLAQLAARGDLPLAVSAALRLRRVPSLDEALGSAGSEALVVALLRADAPALRAALLELLAAKELASMRAALRARLPEARPAPPVILTALATLEGGLPPGEEKKLLAPGSSAEHRRVAALWASGPGAADLLVRLAREDPDPRVRSGAVVRLIELEGADGASRAAAALYDPEPSVRATAAQSLGSLGASAVPELRGVVESGSREAAQAAVAGLMLTGSPESTEALAEIAASHPDPGVRNLAGMALGEETGHRH